MSPNTNCLEGFECPSCNQQDRFKIIALCEVTVFDDGTDNANGFEWDSTSHCVCPDCGKDGVVGDFQKSSVQVEETISG